MGNDKQFGSRHPLGPKHKRVYDDGVSVPRRQCRTFLNTKKCTVPGCCSPPLRIDASRGKKSRFVKEAVIYDCEEYYNE